MEVHFWSLIVAVGMFGIGVAMSAQEGIAHVAHPVNMAVAFDGILLGHALGASMLDSAASVIVDGPPGGDSR